MENQVKYNVQKKVTFRDKLLIIGMLFVLAIMLCVLIGAFGLIMWNLINENWNG